MSKIRKTTRAETIGLTVRSQGEVLVCGCHRDDLEVLRAACGWEGPRVSTVSKPIELLQAAVTHLPVAVVLGVRSRDRAQLNVIAVIRASWSELPVIIVAEEPSFALERRFRQAGIFYYFVHPLDRSEVEAVFNDLLRRTRR